MNQKITFVQFVAGTENSIAGNEEWAEKFLHGLLTSPYHNGDCIKEPQTCSLCLLEEYLRDYSDYYFDRNQEELPPIELPEGADIEKLVEAFSKESGPGIILSSSHPLAIAHENQELIRAWIRSGFKDDKIKETMILRGINFEKPNHDN